MTEYTSLDISRRLAGAGFKAEVDAGVWGGESGCFHYQETLNGATDWSHMARAYRADTLLAWLLSHGDSIEITPDLEGFNVTYWVKHDDYNGINIFLCDALGEVILAVMAKEAKHD